MSGGMSAGSGGRGLGIYLNDHLAGATAGLELFRRAARRRSGTETGRELAALASEVAEDRDELVALMTRLGVGVRGYQVWVGYVGEKLARAKLNGRLLTRSPLSDLVELESLHLGVQGKASGWALLRALTDVRQDLDAARLDRLLARAAEQARRLEELRLRTGRRVLGAGPGTPPR